MARILIIEDNKANLELMAYLLKAFGHMPLAAEDGEQGLALARREVPDLIICDVQMPKMDGYEVARQLKGHPALRAIPLVAVTAFAMVGDRDRVLAGGFDGYLAKPIAPETFVRDVEAFLQPGQHPVPQPAPPAQASHDERTPAATRQATILVVDNAPVNIQLLRSVLEPLGYIIVAAQSVSEGLRLAQQSHPDLILSDIHMPGQDGYELIRIVKADQQLSHIPFAFISASVWEREKDKVRASALGAVGFIERPIEPQALLAEIEACLRETGRTIHGDDLGSR